MCVHIYIYTHMCIYIYIYVDYITLHAAAGRPRRGARGGRPAALPRGAYVVV